MRRPLCLLSLAFAVTVFLLVKLSSAAPPGITFPEGQWLELSGRVYQKEYKINAETSYLVLSLNSITNSETNSQTHPNKIQGILCYLKEGKEPPLGAIVNIRGKVQNFPKATNPGEFDRQSYFQILKLDFSLKHAELLSYSKSHDRIAEGLYRCRVYFSEVLDQCFPEKEASVMRAMLLGDKSRLDPEIKGLYQENGIIHILAVSGLHISLLGMGVYRILKKLRLPQVVAVVSALAFIWCYGIMTAMSASAFRAIFMFVLKLTAQMAGRTYDMLTAVCIAAVLLLIEQPLYLNHAGFLFSFGAVLSLALLAPVFRQKLIPSAVLSVSIGTLPIHLYYYYQFPVYSVLLNLLVIPLMGLVMTGGIASIATFALFPAAAGIAAGAVCLILTFYEKLCTAAGMLPGSQWVTGKPEGWQIFLYLLMVMILCLWHKKFHGVIKAMIVASAVIVLTVRLSDDLLITVLDVGQGDGIHIQTESGEDFLIDAGSSSKKDLEVYQLYPYLKSQKAARLTTVFVTHPDRDHISAILPLLQGSGTGGIDVERLILPHIANECQDEAYRELIGAANLKKIPVFYMSAGQYVESGKLRITALHPPKDYYSRASNEYSLVLLAEYGDFRGLFTGDVEGDGEVLLKQQRLLKDRRLSLLKVAHHGSGNSTDLEFLRLTRPVISIISCSDKNSYGHPHPELIKRLESCGTKIYKTFDSGAVRMKTDGTQIKIEEFDIK